MSMRLSLGNLTELSRGITSTLEGTGNSQMYVLRFHGVHLRKDSGELSTDYFELGDRIPKEFLKQVTWVSCRVWLEKNPTREKGIYKGDGDTVAELDKDNLLRIRGSTVEEVQRLHDQIRAGTIRPTESWEAPQTGMSVDELAEQHTRMSGELASQATKLATAENKLRETMARLAEKEQAQQRILNACSGRWPFIRKSIVRWIIQQTHVVKMEFPG